MSRQRPYIKITIDPCGDYILSFRLTILTPIQNNSLLERSNMHGTDERDSIVKTKPKTPVITVAGRKGGVGKTFTSNLIAIMGAQGGPLKNLKPLKVLLVDVDSQQNTTYYFLKQYGAIWIDKEAKCILPPNPDCPDNEVYNITDIFMGNDFIEYPTKYENLHLIPSDGELDGYRETTKSEFAGRDVDKHIALQFQRFIALVENDYDLIVIDTPPTKSYACRAAVASSTDVVIVTELDAWNAENALPGIMSDINFINEELRNQDNPVNIIGVLPNKISSSSMNKIEKKYLKAMKDRWGHYIYPDFYFNRRVAFQIDEMPAIPDTHEYMKKEDEAKQVTDFYRRIAETALKDTYEYVNANN